jgi:hypothetical protein
MAMGTTFGIVVGDRISQRTTPTKTQRVCFA